RREASLFKLGRNFGSGHFLLRASGSLIFIWYSVRASDTRAPVPGAAEIFPRVCDNNANC
ncbi:MAG TPA: hypothetical protein VG013_06090, partial [Gemmataceae bacterium]|nr:hypothetical protein [Gemmataceae bacterium]